MKIHQVFYIRLAKGGRGWVGGGGDDSGVASGDDGDGDGEV